MASKRVGREQRLIDTAALAGWPPDVSWELRKADIHLHSRNGAGPRRGVG